MRVRSKHLRRALATTNSLLGFPGSLLSAANGDSVRTLLVTSGRDGEGKTTVAVGIASALSRQSNAPVLLVDANHRRPALASWFGITSTPGFSEFLADTSGEHPFHKDEASGLSILSAGGQASISDLLPSFPSRLKVLQDQFSYVVIDGDSTLTSSEASLFARHVDGIVLVAECGQTKWEVISQARERLARLGGRVLGVALNKRKFYIPGVFYGKC